MMVKPLVRICVAGVGLDLGVAPQPVRVIFVSRRLDEVKKRLGAADHPAAMLARGRIGLAPGHLVDERGHLEILYPQGELVRDEHQVPVDVLVAEVHDHAAVVADDPHALLDNLLEGIKVVVNARLTPDLTQVVRVSPLPKVGRAEDDRMDALAGELLEGLPCIADENSIYPIS